jgi:NAD(P)H-dependent flavin oxidoreductase YrpB (nitropropane dioxygenase family)
VIDPVLIQGGMGVAVSGWRLARAVASLGQLGVVSGTALDVVLARRLQAGDPGGEIRRALRHFPDAAAAADLLARFFVPGGTHDGAPFAGVPMFVAEPSRRLQALAAAAGFVEVFLAKDGHDGPVGNTLLESVQPPAVPPPVMCEGPASG